MESESLLIGEMMRNHKIEKAVRLLKKANAPNDLIKEFIEIAEINKRLERGLRSELSEIMLEACGRYNFDNIYNADGKRRRFRARVLDYKHPEYQSDIAPNENTVRAQAIEQAYRRGVVHGFAEARQLITNGKSLDKIERREQELQDWRVSRLQIIGSYPGSKENVPNLGIDEGRSLSPRLRYKIMERDGFRCRICGVTADGGAKLEIDHKESVYDGGDNQEDNLWTLCDMCNRGKGRDSLLATAEQYEQ